MYRKFDLWQTEREKAEQKGNFKILTTDSEKHYSLQMWKGKALKPFANFYFKDVFSRKTYINRQIEADRQYQEEKEKRKLERKGTAEQIEAVKIGTIFYSSWGYEQTNVDFYQVIEKKGQFVTVREIANKTVKDIGYMSENVTASPNNFTGKPFSKKVQFSNGTPYITLNSYSWCSLWDGKEKYCSHYA